MAGVATLRSLLSQRRFAWFWGGTTISYIGDSVSAVALIWVVQELGGSARSVGYVLTAVSAPGVLFGVAAGMLLDRYDRRRLLILDNVVRGLAALALPVLHWWGMLQLWHVVLVAAIHGSFSMLTLAGGPAVIADLVPRSDIGRAVALDAAGYQVATLMGSALAGVGLALVSAPTVILLDCWSFAVMTYCLTRVAMRAEERERPPEKATIRAGVAFLLRVPVLRVTTAAFVVANLGAGALSILAAAQASALGHGGGAAFGVQMTSLALGQLAGAVAAARMSPGAPLRTTLALVLCGGGLAQGLSVHARTIETACVLYFAIGVSLAAANVRVQTVRSLVIPEHLRGRLFAIIRTTVRATLPLSALMTGMIVADHGLRIAGIVTALLVAFAGLVLLAIPGDATALPSQT